ncbi:hypothetical protein V8C26DRAFT_385289 [Trichoderma gracile]
MASHPAIQELTIADLRLNEDNEVFADAVACVQTYWSQASQMSAESQEVMIQLILNQDYALTDWSRKFASRHRLHLTLSKKDDASAWPAFLILDALYKKLPRIYLPTALEDHTDDYLAAFPNTVLPTRYDTRTPEGEAYRETWPNLRNTPTIYRKKEPDTTAPTASSMAIAFPAERPSSALSPPSALCTTAAREAFPGIPLDLMSRSVVATSSSTSPSITTASTTSVATNEEAHISPASQETPDNMTSIKLEPRHDQPFPSAEPIFGSASSTNLSDMPASRGRLATVTASALSSTQTSVGTVVANADAEEHANAYSALSGKRRHWAIRVDSGEA